MINHTNFPSSILHSIQKNYWTLPKLDANFHGKTFKLVDIYSFFFPFRAVFTDHEIIC